MQPQDYVRTTSAVLPKTGGSARLSPPYACTGLVLPPVHAELSNSIEACVEQMSSPLCHWPRWHTRPQYHDRPISLEELSLQALNRAIPHRTAPWQRGRGVMLMGRAGIDRFIMAYRSRGMPASVRSTFIRGYPESAYLG
ncbi:hypothetical protein CsSME_00028430 [Camellia sinensis var. sinensis]